MNTSKIAKQLQRASDEEVESDISTASERGSPLLSISPVSELSSTDFLPESPNPEPSSPDAEKSEELLKSPSPESRSSDAKKSVELLKSPTPKPPSPDARAATPSVAASISQYRYRPAKTFIGGFLEWFPDLPRLCRP